MTFIANVIARDGVALVADSLVTTQIPVLDLSTFIKYLEDKNKAAKGATVTLDPQEVGKLFRSKPIYTRNYEDKLFRVDEYTAIMTAGAAMINDKKIAEIIENISAKNVKLKTYNSMSIDHRVKMFCKFIKEEVKEHLVKYGKISPTIFLYTHFEASKKITEIYRIQVKATDASSLKNRSYLYLSSKKSLEFEKVVYDGQNKITESILFGNFFTSRSTVIKLLDKLVKDNKASKITQKYIDSLLANPEIVDSGQNINMTNLHDLSLQEAVNLASLLMRVELDFQKYTKDIPTVGGVIKLAVIDKNGFRHIHGHEIVKPGNID